MEIEVVSEGLNHSDDPRYELCIRVSPQILGDSSYCAQAQITEETSFVPEEGSHDLGDGEDNLPVGDIEKEVLA
jgi:hypothetical protein